VGVIGGGAWGTALARHCAHMGHDTQLWAREPEVVEGVNDPAVKENTTYLKARPACCLAAPRGPVVLPGAAPRRPRPGAQGVLDRAVSRRMGMLRRPALCALLH